MEYRKGLIENTPGSRPQFSRDGVELSEIPGALWETMSRGYAVLKDGLEDAAAGTTAVLIGGVPEAIDETPELFGYDSFTAQATGHDVAFIGGIKQWFDTGQASMQERMYGEVIQPEGLIEKGLHMAGGTLLVPAAGPAPSISAQYAAKGVVTAFNKAGQFAGARALTSTLSRAGQSSAGRTVSGAADDIAEAGLKGGAAVAGGMIGGRLIPDGIALTGTDLRPATDTNLFYTPLDAEMKEHLTAIYENPGIGALSNQGEQKNAPAQEFSKDLENGAQPGLKTPDAPDGIG